jgi:zinc transporter ZupT
MKILIAILIAVVVAELELALRGCRRGIPGARALLWTAPAQIGIPVVIVVGFLLVESLWPEVKQPGSWWFSPREGIMLVALFWSEVRS